MILDSSGDVYFTGAINVPADVYAAKVEGVPPIQVPAISFLGIAFLVMLSSLAAGRAKR